MSRVGKKLINIPDGVSVKLNENFVEASSSHGNLKVEVPEGIKVNINEEDKVISLQSEHDKYKPMYGTTNSLIDNMLKGLASPYEKKLEIVGVGYRFIMQGDKLVVNAGYSNPVEVAIPSNIEVTVPNQTEVVLKSIDKQAIGAFAAEIRNIRRPEPYKGKGIKYKEEHIRRKEGKKAI